LINWFNPKNPLEKPKQLRKKKKAEGLTVLPFQTYKVIVIKAMWYRYEGRQTNQWNRLKFRNGPTPISPISFQQRSKWVQ
jgi:hypothetical protein